MKFLRLRDFYGGTVRRHHLRCNQHMTYLVAAAVTAVWASFWMDGYNPLPFMFASPIFCRLQETWASPDRDEEESRKSPSLYWLWYGKAVKHRSIFSHSLLVGTPFRFVYGFLPIWLLVWFQMSFSGALALTCWAAIGAIASDLAHYALDV